MFGVKITNIDYKSSGDKNKMLLIEEYLDKSRPY